jgi:hypothetical protein
MKTDIRYRGKCVKCGKKLGDWSLRLTNPTCYEHRRWNLGKEVSSFKSKSACNTENLHGGSE